MDLTDSDLYRFNEKVDRSGECHEWQAQTDPDGYGRFWAGGRKRQAHRVAYYIVHTELPKVVRHTCDNPSCVNPDHLKGGTQRENIADRQAKNRQAKGRENGRAKLDDETVYQCRKEHSNGTSIRELSRKHDLDRTTMRAALRGETWSHVPMPESRVQG
jgi:hypothetical protein